MCQVKKIWKVYTYNQDSSSVKRKELYIAYVQLIHAKECDRNNI
jgi:hypothetical protein